MIEKLKEKLDQFENQQEKVAKLRANIRQELGGKKCSKNFFKALERCKIKQYLNDDNNDNKSKYSNNPKDILNDDSKSKYSNNPENILKKAKKFMKISTPIEAATRAVL